MRSAPTTSSLVVGQPAPLSRGQNHAQSSFAPRTARRAALGPVHALRICACAVLSCLSCGPWRALSRWPACGSSLCRLFPLCRFWPFHACNGASRAGLPRRSLSSIFSCAFWPLRPPCCRGTCRTLPRSCGMHRHLKKLPPRVMRVRRLRIRHEAEDEEQADILFLGCVEKQTATAAKS